MTEYGKPGTAIGAAASRAASPPARLRPQRSLRLRMLSATVLGLYAWSVCGCVGTIFTRGTYDLCGRYPGAAVALDADFIIHPDGKHDTQVLGLLSIIPDLVIDTALLPIDLIAWPLGYRRQ